MIYIGIVGSRKRSEKAQIKSIILNAREKYKSITVVSGGAYGIDREAEDIANYHRISRIIYEPLYHEYEIKGDDIYFERNKKIAELSDYLYAFPLNRMGGTMNTVEWFRKLGKKDKLTIID